MTSPIRTATIALLGAGGVALVLGVWQFGDPVSLTDPYGGDLERQNRTGEGTNVDGIADPKIGGVTLPEEPGVILRGSTDATDLNPLEAGDGVEGWTNDGEPPNQPSAVVTRDRGAVQDDTGLVRTDPDLGIEAEDRAGTAQASGDPDEAAQGSADSDDGSGSASGSAEASGSTADAPGDSQRQTGASGREDAAAAQGSAPPSDGG